MNKHSGLLIGGRKIRQFCGVGTDTLYLWMEKYGFPVTRFPTERGAGYWVTSPSLVEEWLRHKVQTPGGKI